MPIHDWTQVKSGKFHDFHQDWVIEIRRALNNGLLPPATRRKQPSRSRGAISTIMMMKKSKGK